MSNSNWVIAERTHDELIDHLCYLRGFDKSALVPDYSQHLHDPNLLPDIEKARELLRLAKKEGWFVTVFGDYDADGTPAAALLSILLNKIGIKHTVQLPTRTTGYGLRQDTVKNLPKNTKLLITVDTGVTAVDEIAQARKKGIHVIVLDHHLPGSQLPPADAVVDPHRQDSVYPFPHLCGCALAYKLAVALTQDFKELDEPFCKWLLDLVAISTVADMMPLIGENRVLVHCGLIVLKQNRRVGLQALLETAGVEPGTVSAGTLGFIIGPRLNASGRLSDNRPAYDLLIATDLEEARQIAEKIERANSERQALVEQVLKQAEELIFKQNQPSDKVFLLLGEDWPSGVVGLVAGKLSGKYFRPVIVGTTEGNEIRASARSIESYPIVDALHRHSTFLHGYGGHKQAAGMSVEKPRWNEFCASLKLDAEERLDESEFIKKYQLDAVLKDGEINLQTVLSLDSLQPFGLGNPKPALAIDNVRISEVKFIGGRSNHLKLRLQKK